MNRSSREAIWGHPHIVGEDVLSTTKIFTGARPFLKAYIKPFDIMDISMLTQAEKKLPVPGFFYRINEVIQSNHSFCR